VSSGWLALLLLSSCSLSAPIEHGANVSPIERPRHEIEGVAQEVVGLSVENRPIVAHVMGEGPETFLLIGVIHGNEPAGKTLLERFMGHVLDTPALLEERRLVIVPVANPDGYRRGSRHNANGVDLNRNFPSADWRPMSRNGSSPASEPETRALLRLVRQFRPSRVLSVHAPLEMVNWDGPAESLAEAMASACGYPASASVGYPTPGSFGSYAGIDWHTPTITLELGRDIDHENVWPRFQNALEVFVLHPRRPPRVARTRPVRFEEEL